MRVQSLPMRCKKCGHEFHGDMLVDVPIKLAIEAIKAVRCPACDAGYRSLSFITKPEPAGD